MFTFKTLNRQAREERKETSLKTFAVFAVKTLIDIESNNA